MPSMLRIHSLFGLLILTAVLLPVQAAEFRATRLTTTPVIDGVFARDAAWRGHDALSSFTQVQPIDGNPASQQTRIHIGFDDDTLYIAAICLDDEPDNIIVTSNQRDASVTESDSLRFIIDTFQSGQNGLVFGTNPGDMQYDAQVSGFDFDLNWDTTWEVATTVHDVGWSAEFAIPFTSLRFKPGNEQRWGINVERRIRRNNEVAYWSPIPIQYSLSRVELAGTVSGIDVPRQRNFQVIPYITSRQSRGGELTDTDSDTEVGLDLKYALTSALTLDVTWNTDFAQVEVDSLQVNLNRFNLFFLEKRPFFLENAGQFGVRVPGLMQLFHTRRIGIGPGGSQLPIDGGLRVSGKTGRNTNLGLLFMRTSEVADLAEGTDFGVLRVKQEFRNRSSMGVLLVDKTDVEDDNQTFAVDGQLGIGDNLTLSGFVAQTDSIDIPSDDSAFFLSSN